LDEKLVPHRRGRITYMALSEGKKKSRSTIGGEEKMHMKRKDGPIVERGPVPGGEKIFGRKETLDKKVTDSSSLEEAVSEEEKVTHRRGEGGTRSCPAKSKE